MATIIKYDGTNFSLDGDTSYDIASEYLYGVQYEVSFGIKIVSETNPTISFFPTDLILEITMDGIGVTAGSIEDFDVLGGDIEFSVTYKDGIKPSISGIYNDYLYLGFSAEQLKSESSFELLIKWQSKADSAYWGEETITINTPVYYTAPTLPTSITGTSNRGNITFKWNFQPGINNPITRYNLQILPYDSEGDVDLSGGGDNVNLISTPSVQSYVFKDGKLGYSYDAYLDIVSTHGSKFVRSSKIQWKPLIFRKTSSGWEEIDNIDYVKTLNGWSSAKQIFFKTDDGWKEI
jgi:hypothetical protein